MKFLTILFFLSLSTCKSPSPGMKDAELILAHILDLKQQLESIPGKDRLLCQESKCIFLSIWDFDGTIMKGDSSEGLMENGKKIFPGMLEVGILAGKSKSYQGENGFLEAEKEYLRLDSVDRFKAYYFLPQVFAGTTEKEFLDLSQSHYEKTMQKYYFPASKMLLQKLKENGIRSLIISASASFIVQASHTTLPIAKEDIHGVRLEIQNGVITSKEIYPLTYAEGKRETLQALVQGFLDRKEADHVFVLAGFGNSYSTDGPFLQYISDQSFPKGSPISTMINGGETPEKYKDIFRLVTFDL